MEIAVVVTGLLISTHLFAADKIPSAQANHHIGETAVVCGKVVGSRYLESGSRPTFLNFDKPYPNHTFTAVIFGANRERFGTPEKDYLQKDVCVTGKIEEYNHKPQIVLTEREQIKLNE